MTTYRYSFSVTNPGLDNDRHCDTCYHAFAPGEIVHYFRPDSRNQSSIPLCECCAKAGRTWAPQYTRIDTASFRPVEVLVWGSSDASWTPTPIANVARV